MYTWVGGSCSLFAGAVACCCCCSLSEQLCKCCRMNGLMPLRCLIAANGGFIKRYKLSIQLADFLTICMGKRLFTTSHMKVQWQCITPNHVLFDFTCDIDHYTFSSKALTIKVFKKNTSHSNICFRIETYTHTVRWFTDTSPLVQ